MKLTLEYQDGMKFHSFDDQQHLNIYDSAPAGESTAGPTPMQVFLQALAACAAMDIVAIIKKRRRTIDKFVVEVTGERVDTYPKIYKTINIKYIISGDGINDKEMNRAMDLSVNKLCSIMGMMDRNKTDVKVSYEIVR